MVDDCPPFDHAINPTPPYRPQLYRRIPTKPGYSPSLADLAPAFGVRSKNAVAKVVNILVREGQLEKDPKGRIKIMDMSYREDSMAQPMMLPLFGPISAGFAAPVEEQAEEMISLDS